jgi:hypothetical protein
MTVKPLCIAYLQGDEDLGQSAGIGGAYTSQGRRGAPRMIGELGAAFSKDLFGGRLRRVKV